MNMNVDELVSRLTSQTQELINSLGTDQPLMIGIHTGGIWIADHLHQALNLEKPLGILDISFYRDDFSRLGLNPQVKPSKIPLDITDEHIILVDDVLHTGRTVRAALNELFDYGRPASVHLAVLIDRGGRELPVAAQVSGKTIDLPPHQHVKLTGPKPLKLEVITTS
ncbi:MAG: bifunctional pyr operon transcriptional regulator/uracil phosphoribosyltransferase PyrR [Gammaproteobacteria bacterium]